MRGARGLSPVTLNEALPDGLPNVTYHLSVLRSLGVLELVGTERRRGAVEHFYGLGGKRGNAVLEALDAVEAAADPGA